MTASTLGRGMRGVLLACGPMNLVGAVCFSPPMPAAAGVAALPDLILAVVFVAWLGRA